MIKHTILILTLLATAQAEETKPYYDLGEQLVSSIRNNDIAEFSSCWASSRCMVQVKASATGKPVSKKGLEGAVQFVGRRNKHVAHSFTVLTELFKKEGELKNLKLIDVSIEGDIKERGGVKMISVIYITVKSDKSQYIIAIDDAFEYKGMWYFMDNPMYIKGGPSNNKVSLRKPYKGN